MVHVFSFMDLVDCSSITSKNSKHRNVQPIHTFSVHHFPVTSLAQVSAGRIASAAEDGQVLIMELFSKEILVNIQFPHGVQCLKHHGGRLYAGSTRGTIYSVDLNAYAMHQTEKLGAIFAGKRKRQEHISAGSTQNWSLDEKVFGKKNQEKNNSGDDNENYGSGYQTDWIGHDHAVTSIGFITDDEQQRMISGDNFGQIRIWEMESRTCLNVIQPWSFTNANSISDSKVALLHPVTSISIIPQPTTSASRGLFDLSSNKNLANISSLVTPLQKYVSDPNDTLNNIASSTSVIAGKIRVPFLNSNRTKQNLEYWEARPILRKRRRGSSNVNEAVATNNDRSKDEGQIAFMKKQIEELKNEVKRWQTVNNKLMSRLQTKS